MNAVDFSENNQDVDNTNISYGPYGHKYLEDFKVKKQAEAQPLCSKTSGFKIFLNFSS